MPPVLRRMLREPLLHFVILGAVLFLGRVMWDRSTQGATEENVIVLSEGFLGAIEADKGASPEARRKAFVREEVLVREGRKLGLDEGDPIIRRRIAQKMEFLLEATAEDTEPDEAALERYFREHSEELTRPGRTSFRHRFFSRDRRGTSAQSDAEAALRLATEHAEDFPAGDPFLLGHSHADRTDEEIARTFGPDFARALRPVPVGAWSGPIESPYGHHLVLVSERTPPALPPLSEIRAEVRLAVRESRKKAALEREVARLLGGYRIVTEDESREDP